ncbi:hypothetical protein [Spirosoma endbachense]|uniref:Uncharacterized protein n=1 Tax=Spirosoma endbachense TaxID=2666025 RepID=A0A6P1W227_9BACT|nr:hypothetical protein [Spirosoma endbachense]QHV99095.1 hypothetical protein GJR95_30610 [Spirosoma endbachense]
MKPLPISPKPRTWKMLLISWVFAYPAINLILALVGPYLKDLHPLLSSFLISLLLLPTFGFGLPAFQGLFRQWLCK